MICGHSCSFWWFVRDGVFGIQVRLWPLFHRRLAEPTEQLDDALRRIWRSQSSICGRRLRRPGIVEDQVSACDVILMSIQLLFFFPLKSCHSMLCISILFHVISERVPFFYILLEHFLVWKVKTDALPGQHSAKRCRNRSKELTATVTKMWKPRRFFRCVCVCVCAVSSC